MTKKRIFYSIDVDFEDNDILTFIRLNHPGIKFNYEYVEDVKEEKPDYLNELINCVKPEKDHFQVMADLLRAGHDEIESKLKNL